MIQNYFKSAWRNLWKNKAFSVINIAGLAIGLAACILILKFVFYERSFDTFHTKNIYRLNEVQKFEGMVAAQKVALTMFPMAPTLKAELPEIINFTRVSQARKLGINYGDKKIFLDRVYNVDSTFLDMFDFPLLNGDRSTALEKPTNIVLTASSAQKFFGTDEAIGKTLTLYSRNDTTDLMVTGVLKDVLQNSQFQFDALVPFNVTPNMMNNWGGNWLNTYFELVPEVDVAAMEIKFPTYLKKYMTRNDNWKNYELFLLPFKDVHGSANDIGLDSFNYQQFDKKYTNLFFIIALMVLLIACINFMNLSTAQSAERAREVGVRKSVGAYRWQLAFQFLSESVMLSFIAIVIAVVIVKLTLPWINQLSRRDLDFTLFDWKLPVLLLLGSLTLGLISGLYPAAYLSSFQPVKVLKGSIQSGRNKGNLRSILVVFQFASAIFLIITTTFAIRQLRFMKNQPTGYDREQIVNVSFNRGASQKFNVLKQELLQNTLIKGVTASQDVLGSHLDQSGIQFKGDGPLRRLTSTRLIVDPDYLNVYQIKLLTGKNFIDETSAIGREYIINESLANELLKDGSAKDINSLIGKQFGFDSTGTIVGIAHDFNFNSLHHKIETMFMFNQTNWGFGNMSVKIDEQQAQAALAYIESVWQKVCPEFPFEYEFLDDHFNELYLADSQISTIVGALAILAIIISCLGLFGLASYSAERRIKEVGIRKVLGASIHYIVLMLSKDFLRFVGLAALIAWPLAWFAVHSWLQDYAFRVEISWWIFLAAGLIAVLIAQVTISFRAIQAAMKNPVTSLRSE